MPEDCILRQLGHLPNQEDLWLSSPPSRRVWLYRDLWTEYFIRVVHYYAAATAQFDCPLWHTVVETDSYCQCRFKSVKGKKALIICNTQVWYNLVKLVHAWLSREGNYLNLNG